MNQAPLTPRPVFGESIAAPAPLPPAPPPPPPPSQPAVPLSTTAFALRPLYAKPIIASQNLDLPSVKPHALSGVPYTVPTAHQFLPHKPPPPAYYQQPGQPRQIMSQNGAPPNPSASPQNMRPMAPPMTRPGGPGGPINRPPGPPSSPAPGQYPNSPGVRPQMPSPGMQRPPMPAQNMRPTTPQQVRAPNMMPQNVRPPFSPQNSMAGIQSVRSAAPSPIRAPGQPPMQANLQQNRPTPIPQQVINNRPPSMPFRSSTQNSDQLGSERNSPENLSRMQSDLSMGKTDSPKSSYLSTDDDEDVVIGKTQLASTRSPEGQISPTTKISPSVPFTRSDSQMSIPSRPPSGMGSYGKPGGNSQPLQSNEIVYKEKHAYMPDKPLDGYSAMDRVLSPSPDQNRQGHAASRAPSSDNLVKHGKPQDLGPIPVQGLRSKPAGSALTPGGGANERVTFVLPNETNGQSHNSEPMRKTPVPPNFLEKPDAGTRGRSPYKNSAMDRNRSPVDHKGDNDSGVDESTQEKERNGPGSPGSPLKSPSKIPSLRRPDSITPQTRSRSTSKQRLTAKTPETPNEPLIKKVPMNKIQVGATPSPNLKVVKSKIGSLENATHKPGGGNVKIETKKIEIKAAPRIEAKNDAYVPKGGDKKIISNKLQWNARSKIGSLENANHKPGGGDKKIETLKTDFKDRAHSKVGSKDNLGYTPGGGDIKIVNQKLDIKAESKVGSLENVKHKPGGGNKKIFDDKEYLRQIDHPVALTPPTQRSMRRMAASMSGVELARELQNPPPPEPISGPASLATSRRPSTMLTSSLSLPAECIVLSQVAVPPDPAEPSPERKLRRVESTRSFIRRDGRAIHPKPFRIY
ncbi:microtubule-associated protein tau isoform X2 [Uranotaenia lowii]|uniref:microtubule-associated protein tau isoform X2 n=1 Tax=Uranotaenia lowii TaxID=190385 RepID=UPI0024784095|nr:microtubule-associated protein tau isoform X2 [Uranotaenia lowii]